MYRILLVILACLYSCSNPFQDSLVGKKLFLLDVNTSTRRFSGLPISISNVKEVGLFFKSSTEVEIFPTAYYGTYLLADRTVTPSVYNYTYNNGDLNILELGTGIIKLTNSGEYYSADDGEVLYKKSILELPAEGKKDRLNKVLDYPADIEKSYLNKEVVFELSDSKHSE